MRNNLGVLLLLCVAACAQTAPKPAPFAKVRISQQGKVLLNERPSSLDQLDINFEQLAKEHGIVWLYSQDGSPSLLVQRVKKKIDDYHLAHRNCKDYDDADCKEAIP
jgi:hypothetical protein